MKGERPTGKKDERTSKWELKRPRNKTVKEWIELAEKVM